MLRMQALGSAKEILLNPGLRILHDNMMANTGTGGPAHPPPGQPRPEPELLRKERAREGALRQRRCRPELLHLEPAHKTYVVASPPPAKKTPSPWTSRSRLSLCHADGPTFWTRANGEGRLLGWKRKEVSHFAHHSQLRAPRRLHTYGFCHGTRAELQQVTHGAVALYGPGRHHFRRFAPCSR